MSTGINQPGSRYWRQLYRAALSEIDQSKLPERIAEAEKAVVLRAREMYWQHGCFSPMMARSKVFITARNKHVVPKQRRIERLPSGYAIREFSDDSRGRFWYVVTAFEVVRARKCSR